MFKYNKTFSSYSVNDISKAVEFYEKTLGLKLLKTPEGLQIDLEDNNDLFIYEKNDHTPTTFYLL